MYKGLLNTLVQPLFCSLNLLFGGARRGLFQTLFTLRRRNLKSHPALFLRLSLGSRVIRHENGAFTLLTFTVRFIRRNLEQIYETLLLFISKRPSVWDSHTLKEIHDIQILGIQFIIEYQGM